MTSTKPTDLDSLPRVAVTGAGYWGKNLVRNLISWRPSAISIPCDWRPAESNIWVVPRQRLLKRHSRTTLSPTVAIATPAKNFDTMMRTKLGRFRPFDEFGES